MPLQIFKLHLVTYKSSTTGKTEIACYIFLEKEDERSVRDAICGWRILMPYTEDDIGGMIYVGVVSICLM